MRFFRLLRIVSTIGRHGLDEFLVGRGLGIVRLAVRVAFFWADRSGPRGVRLRLALEGTSSGISGGRFLISKTRSTAAALKASAARP